MTYQEAKSQPEAKNWTIRKSGESFTPVYKGKKLDSSFAKNTIEAARLFILCSIAGNARYEEINNSYNPMGWDAC